MTTRVIGIKEFRQNMSRLSKEAKKKKIRFIVMNHLVPVFEVNAIADEEALEDQLLLEKYSKQIERGMKDYKRGKFFTAEEVRQHLLRRT